MEFNPIERFVATVPLSVHFESSYAGVHVTGVSMTDGPIAVMGLDGDDLPVVHVDEQPDSKVWPDGMEDLNLVTANQSRNCPDISEMVYHTVHEEPLILYIPNFVSPEETSHLLDITYALKTTWIGIC
jgi:prolyl 4-hydroxylase